MALCCSAGLGSSRLDLGDRRVALETRLDALPAADTVLVASFLGTTSFRLLVEPKDTRLEPPRLSVSEHPDALRVHTDRPVIDLFLWDPDGGLDLLDKFITPPSRLSGAYARPRPATYRGPRTKGLDACSRGDASPRAAHSSGAKLTAARTSLPVDAQHEQAPWLERLALDDACGHVLGEQLDGRDV